MGCPRTVGWTHTGSLRWRKNVAALRFAGATLHAVVGGVLVPADGLPVTSCGMWHVAAGVQVSGANNSQVVGRSVPDERFSPTARKVSKAISVAPSTSRTSLPTTKGAPQTRLPSPSA